MLSAILFLLLVQVEVAVGDEDGCLASCTTFTPAGSCSASSAGDGCKMNMIKKVTCEWKDGACADLATADFDMVEHDCECEAPGNLENPTADADDEGEGDDDGDDDADDAEGDAADAADADAELDNMEIITWCRMEGRIITGYANDERVVLFSLSQAQEECAATDACGGITMEAAEGNLYTMRKKNGAVVESSRGEISWLKGGCNEVTSTSNPTSVCVADCSQESDFIAKYDLATGIDEMCSNDITKAVTGRGGQGCVADPWFTIAECNKLTCQKLMWRSSNPQNCDVEDRYTWCCDPIVDVDDATTGMDCSETAMHCLVQAEREKLGDIRFTWFDSNGNNLAFVEGFSVSEPTEVDDDKMVSVLNIGKGADLIIGEQSFHCRVTDGLEVWSDTGVLTAFDVMTFDVVQPQSDDSALILCKAPGSSDDWPASSISWTFVDPLSGRTMTVSEDAPADGYTVTVFGIAGAMASTLQVGSQNQVLGDTVFTCQVKYTGENKCGDTVTSCQEEAESVLTIWALDTTEYCAHVGDEAVVSVTVLGANPSFPITSVSFTGPDDEVYTSDSGEEYPGYSVTFEEDDDGDMVATLTISPEEVDQPETRTYIGKIAYGGEEASIPSVLYIMEIEPSDDIVAQIDTDDTPVFTATIVGGTLDNPVWSDDVGNVFTPENPVDGYTVTVSDDGTSTTLVIDPSQLTKIGTKVFTVVVDTFAPNGDFCSKDFEEFQLTTFECAMEYAEAECDPDRLTCAVTYVMRPGSCVCTGGYGARGSCPADSLTEIPVACEPTKEFSLTDWEPETCVRVSCYPFVKSKERLCVCDDIVNAQMCDAPLVTNYVCPGRKPWTVGDWSNAYCPNDPCFPATAEITRECLCDDYSDNSKCEELLSTEVDCPTEPFEWSEWNVKDCSGALCYPTIEERARTCSCRDNFDDEACEGDRTEYYQCEPTLDWTPVPAEPSICDGVEELCHDVARYQPMDCMCNGQVDQGQCTASELQQSVVCPAKKEFELSDWVDENECEPCFPEIPKTKKRTCSCDNEVDVSGDRCDAELVDTESCPATGVWDFTEWVPEPCDVSCREVLQTARSRQCMCEYNVDNTRCEGPLTDMADCELTPFLWSPWESRPCPDVCFSATTKRYRICQCEDEIDFNECPGLAIEFLSCDKPARCYPRGAPGPLKGEEGEEGEEGEGEDEETEEALESDED